MIFILILILICGCSSSNKCVEDIKLLKDQPNFHWAYEDEKGETIYLVQHRIIGKCGTNTISTKQISKEEWEKK